MAAEGLMTAQADEAGCDTPLYVGSRRGEHRLRPTGCHIWYQAYIDWSYQYIVLL